MAVPKKEFGIIGLGRMGASLSLQALEKGMRVVGLERKGAPEDLLRANLVEAHNTSDFRQLLSPPRCVFLYIPAGPPVDELLRELATCL